ncbi:hypothetical protein G6F57_015241 [Rhizopus arrhizus]|nr:hypothetical protein G6F63_014732 [Rhizopus arrhizus]KAG1455714.1 hypothetical protein G6F57_015241 [Rhizopus arrhizus]
MPKAGQQRRHDAEDVEPRQAKDGHDQVLGIPGHRREGQHERGAADGRGDESVHEATGDKVADDAAAGVVGLGVPEAVAHGSQGAKKEQAENEVGSHYLILA